MSLGFSMNSVGSGYDYNPFGSNYESSNYRQYRNATVSTQKALAGNIASTHRTQLKNAYLCLENGDVSKFQSILAEIETEEAAKSRTYNIDESEIRSAIETAYESVTGGDYSTSVDETARSSFASGFNQIFLFSGSKNEVDSAADIKAKMLGTKTRGSEQTKEAWGGAIGGAVIPGIATGIAFAINPIAGLAMLALTSVSAYCGYKAVENNNKASGTA